MNYHEFFRKVEAYLDKIENQASLRETLGLIIESILQDFSVDLGFTGARLYVRDIHSYILEEQFGAGSHAPIGLSIPESYPPIKTAVRKGFVYMDLRSEGVDPVLMERIGIRRFAAIAVGPANKYVIAFSLAGERADSQDEILFTLSTIRHAVTMKLAKESLEDIILQSKEIQLSMLPENGMVYAGFDIAGRSVPAEIVGGDLYDYIRINPKILGVAIGDATGHGLPAALQARDAIIGLRMGLSEHQKMVRVFERLNTVIHRSHLTSRFVSVFYMEIESNGQIIYCNAGHTTPYYYRAKKDKFYPLTDGGMVLGPTSDAIYNRGFFLLQPGDGVILYTDGIIEARNGDGEEFGEKRVLDYVRESIRFLSAREIVHGIHEKVQEFAFDDPHADDRTVVFVRRLPEE